MLKLNLEGKDPPQPDKVSSRRWLWPWLLLIGVSIVLLIYTWYTWR